MIVNVIHVYVKPDHVDDFIKATIENHDNSIKETGNLRFDVLQSNDDPTKFLLYEAYISQEAAAEHKNTSHYVRWRDTVAEWMAHPRQGTTYKVLAPIEEKSWK